MSRFAPAAGRNKKERVQWTSEATSQMLVAVALHTCDGHTKWRSVYDAIHQDGLFPLLVDHYPTPYHANDRHLRRRLERAARLPEFAEEASRLLCEVRRSAGRSRKPRRGASGAALVNALVSFARPL
jgi:hypothetical protein